MSLPSSPPHPLASMSVKQIQYLPCRRSLSHSRKVGPAVAYQPTVVAMPPLTLPPLQGPSTVCILQAALQGHSPAAVVDRVRSPHHAARPKQLATSAASQPQLSQRKPQLNWVSERLASGESTVLSYRDGIFVGSFLSIFCFFCVGFSCSSFCFSGGFLCFLHPFLWRLDSHCFKFVSRFPFA